MVMIALDLGVGEEEESAVREIGKDDLVYLKRGLNFLRYWPIEKLLENTASSSIYYFHRNTVLVRDSNNSDWIYVVLKGSLSVLKKLKRFNTGADEDKRDSRTKGNKRFHADENGPITLPALDTSKRQRRRGQWKNLTTKDLPVLKEEHFKSTVELETKLAKSLPGYINIKDRLLSLDYDTIIKNYQSRLLVKGTRRSSEKSFHKDDVLAIHNKSGSLNTHIRDNQGEHQGSNYLSLPDIEITNKVTQQPKTESLGDSITGNSTTDNRITDNRATDNGTTDKGTTDNFTTDNSTTNNEDIREHSGTSVGDGRAENIMRISDNEVTSEKCLNSIETEVSQDDSLHISTSNEAEVRKKLSRMGTIKSLKGAYLAATRVKKPESVIVDSASDSSVENEQLTDLRQEDGELSSNQKIDNLQLRYQLAMIGREGRKTIAEELDQKGRRDYKVTEADIDPVFVRLQVLERGQYFGIVQLLYLNEPSLSVVSNGAECLVISKKHFKAWATDKCWRHLEQTECPYPKDEELARKLHEEIEWRAASSALYKEIQAGVRLRRSKLKQFHPAYIGEYCFRTGPV